MKNNSRVLLVVAVHVLLIGNVVNGQSTGTGTASGIPNWPLGGPGTPGDFLGWAANARIPLEIRTDDVSSPQPINWFTQTFARMQIFEDPSDPNAFNSGFVGLGDFGFVFGGGAATFAAASVAFI